MSAIIKTIYSAVILTQVFGTAVNNSCQVVGVIFFLGVLVDIRVNYLQSSKERLSLLK